MALLSALTSFAHIPRGFTNKTLRKQIADLLGSDGTPYGTSQMSYDLRRLRKKGIIGRIPNSYRYRPTTYGLKVALFFTKLDARIFRRFLAATDSSQPVPLPLAAAFEQVEQTVAELVNHAHLAPSVA
jgi:hypothetical protein